MQHKILIDLISLGAQIRKDKNSVPEWLITKFDSYAKEKTHFPKNWRMNNQTMWNDETSEMYVDSIPYVICSCGKSHRCVIEKGYAIFNDTEDDNSWDPGSGY